MNLLRRFAPLLLFISCLISTACGSTSSSSVTLRVFAAASLTKSFTTIGQHYHQAHPTTTITFNFAGSQTLEQQMANGAAADVFASADLGNMQKANKAGLTSTSQVFAQNKLVVIVPANNPANISTLKDLAKPGIKIDLAAPSVPAGEYALQVLDKMERSAQLSRS